MSAQHLDTGLRLYFAIACRRLLQESRRLTSALPVAGLASVAHCWGAQRQLASRKVCVATMTSQQLGVVGQGGGRFWALSKVSCAMLWRGGKGISSLAAWLATAHLDLGHLPRHCSLDWSHGLSAIMRMMQAVPASQPSKRRLSSTR